MSLNDATGTDRDAKGRFAAGNPGGPGNPFARQVAQLRQVMLEMMNEVQVRLITQQLLTMALAGDIQAMKLFFAYAVGKPERMVNPDELDLQEWELRQRQAVSPVDIDLLQNNMPARQANAVAQAVAPAVALKHGLDVCERLRKRGLLPEAMQPTAQPPAPAGKPSRPEVRGGNKGDAGARR